MPWLADKIAEVVAVKGHSKRTTEAYTHWAREFFFFCKNKHPQRWTAADVKAFLTWMATKQPPYSHKSQKQAKNALVYVARYALGLELGDFSGYAEAREYRRPPTVLSKEEVLKLLATVEKKTPARLRVDVSLRTAAQRVLPASRAASRRRHSAGARARWEGREAPASSAAGVPG